MVMEAVCLRAQAQDEKDAEARKRAAWKKDLEKLREHQ